MDVRAHQRRAWNREVDQGNVWTVPVTSEAVTRARAGEWSVVLTPVKPVPRDWFPPLAGRRLLGLASAGGQQGPILAAAGALVTVLDNSPAQLDRDRQVAERDGLDLECVEGDMADLSAFPADHFDVVFHPVSNVFVEDVRAVWREAARVLRPGGVLLAGFCNPVSYIFDHEATERGELVVRHRLPYSDLTSLAPDERQRLVGDEPLAFGHTLDDQIGGQLAAGLVITGFYEDSWPEDSAEPLNRYLPTFMATRAVKPAVD